MYLIHSVVTEMGELFSKFDRFHLVFVGVGVVVVVKGIR